MRIYLRDVVDLHAQLVNDVETGQVSVRATAAILVNGVEVPAGKTMPLQHRDIVRISTREFRIDYGMGATVPLPT